MRFYFLKSFSSGIAAAVWIFYFLLLFFFSFKSQKICLIKEQGGARRNDYDSNGEGDHLNDNDDGD